MAAVDDSPGACDPLSGRRWLYCTRTPLPGRGSRCGRPPGAATRDDPLLTASVVLRLHRRRAGGHPARAVGRGGPGDPPIWPPRCAARPTTTSLTPVTRSASPRVCTGCRPGRAAPQFDLLLAGTTGCWSQWVGHPSAPSSQYSLSPTNSPFILPQSSNLELN